MYYNEPDQIEKNKIKNILENFSTTATDAVKHDVFSLAATFLYLIGIFPK